MAFVDNFAMLPTIGPFARSLGADAGGVGLAVAAYSLANVPGNLLGGLLVDRVGRRRVALLAMVGAALSVGAYAFASTMGILLGLRLVHGLAGGVLVSALFTLASDLAPPGSRGRTMGRMGAMIGLAAVAAPALAGVVRQAFGFASTFSVVAAAMLAGVLLLVLGSRAAAPAPLGPDGGPPPDEEIVSRGWSPLAAWRWLMPPFLAVLAFTTGFGVLTAFLPTQIEAAQGSPAVSGALFAALALVAVLLMLSRVTSRVDRGRSFAPMVIGLSLIAVALLVLATVPPLAGAVAGCLLFGTGFGLVYPSATGTVASVPAAGRGRALGLFNATYSLGFIVGPPVAGRLSLAGVSPYAFAAVVCAACLVAVTLLAAREPEPTGGGGPRQTTSP
jgi:MFS family permease